MDQLSQAMYASLDALSTSAREENIKMRTPEMAPGMEDDGDSLTFEARQVFMRNNFKQMGIPDEIID